ncbi:MAG: hypothetical protein QOI10_4455 [Solirubrobacterales bacterium]|nr:hypothetical protein [Solirubrobacterales bacterium]
MGFASRTSPFVRCAGPVRRRTSSTNAAGYARRVFRIGLVAFLAALAGLLANLIAGHFQTRYSAWIKRSRWNLTASLVACALLAALPATLLSGDDGDNQTAAGSTTVPGGSVINNGTNIQNCAPGSNCEQNNVVTTVTTQVPVSATQLCRDPDPTDPALPNVEVCIIAWCRGTVLDSTGKPIKDQGQIKLRPRIINNASTPLSVSIERPSALRLLVSTNDVPNRWKPPPGTVRGGDIPQLVEWNGVKYWAIPPNVPGDARPVQFEEGGITYTTYDGFATYWDATVLQSGGILYKPIVRDSDGHGRRETDLVFNVPAEPDGSLAVFGLAVVDPATTPGRVLGVSGRNAWPPQVRPDSF